MRCAAAGCDALADGRVYWHDDSRKTGPANLTVNLHRAREPLVSALPSAQPPLRA